VLSRKKLKVEQPLSPFASTENHSSNEPLLIDPDARVSSLESLKSAIGALSFLHELITKGTATIGIRHNTLGICRAKLGQLDKFLGAKDDLKQEEELKKNLLRQANLENHRLREEMGKGVTIESIGSKLHQLDRSIYNWWQNLGFTYSSAKLQPHSHGATFHVEFSVGVERHVSSHSEKPVTDRARMNAKREALGAELEIVYKSDDPYVVDNPNNRAWLTNKFKERFPTCRIWKWESISARGLDDVFQIRHVEVNIDMTDVGDEPEKNEKYDGF